MQVPSGKYYSDDDLAIVRMMHVFRFIQRLDEPAELNSGLKTQVYINGREDLTDNPVFEWRLGKKIAGVVYDLTTDPRQTCLLGIPTAGNTLAQAASSASHRDSMRGSRPEICHRMTRQQTKAHGTHKRKWVDGVPDDSRHQYWAVDNAVTSGKGIMQAADRFEADGYNSRAMPYLIVVDRQQGAVPRLLAAGFENIIVIYNLLDITFALGQMGLWPKEAIVAVEAEIAAHQFKV